MKQDHQEMDETRRAALAQLEEHLSFRLSRLNKLLDMHATRNLTQSDLNLTDYRILLVLSLFGETSAADLSRLMVIDRAQISRSVGALIRAGHLLERGDPRSRRRKLLSLSKMGQAALAREKPFFETRQKMFEDILSPQELEGLMAAIDKLSRHMAGALDHPEAIPLTAAR